MLDTPHPRSLAGTLYSPRFEHEACGTGFVADLRGPSHAVVESALDAVENLAHRGGTNADAATGDGAGVLCEVPQELVASVLPNATGPVAVGMLFLPTDDDVRARCIARVEEVLVRAGARVHVWRNVPTNPSTIGRIARASQPFIAQVFAEFDSGAEAADLERTLFRARRNIEQLCANDGLYVCSLSTRTIVYKGMLKAQQLRSFFPDLVQENFTSRYALFHQRFSTNTFPSWERAQPLRTLGHNGEINTLDGNVNWWRARECSMEAECWGGDLQPMLPIIDEAGSDSTMLDNVAEFLTLSGRDLHEVMSMLIPAAPQMSAPEIRPCHDVHSGIMEPWDGPAAVAFTDGVHVGTVVDRNGLRPARYAATLDGLVFCASEAGVFDLDDSTVRVKGQLGPGQMLSVNVETGTVEFDDEIVQFLAGRHPFADWLAEQRVQVPRHTPIDIRFDSDRLNRLHNAFGYTREEIAMVVKPMVSSAAEPVGSMGDDTPQAVLSDVDRSLFNSFKQRFAEVTNPPIDALRERQAMTLRTLLGPRRNVLATTSEHARLIEVESPILLDGDLVDLQRAARNHGVPVGMVPCLLTVGEESVSEAVERICVEVEAEIAKGATIVVLSDRAVDAQHAPMPALLVVSSVHHHLIRQGTRMDASIVMDSGEARDVHHLAAMIGYGANAVCPYLALSTARSLATERNTEADTHAAATAVVTAFEAGLLKIMAKMGIATVDSYCGAQVFEAIGLAPEVVERHFVGTPYLAGGIDLASIEARVLSLHSDAFAEEDAPRLDNPGYFKFKRGGEQHAHSPANVKLVHHALEVEDVLEVGFAEGYRRFREYTGALRQQPPTDLRDVLTFVADEPIDISEVEPASEIVRRFSTGAMSHGSLSSEAHETLAIAMNRLGARSNSGEGGEDPERYGTERNSRVKQVASARFGVTPSYLQSADELQIKMAQGSKPGEGGQLPGHKVTDEIARIRHTTPGVQLISPPPHHDIYSIEDLAQLIGDLKQAHPAARVSVKLVSERGVGTIAAGVTKAGADGVLISGHAGGTGASPLSSIKNAGLPWELGLAETQQTLVANELRGRVSVRVDGGLRTGRDVVVAAMLGADEYSFGTSALIAMGCLMARTCHNNQCPVGIATQRHDLRDKFPGEVERVMAYMLFVAEHVRELLAQLGYRTLQELIGRSDLLVSDDERASSTGLRFEPILAQPDVPANWPRRHEGEHAFLGESTLNDLIVRDAWPAIAFGGNLPRRLHRRYVIQNTNRTVGARLSGEIARRFGDRSLPDDTIQLSFDGVAGQSFGAFCVGGLTMTLTGEANDYVGKGLAGAVLVVRPPENTERVSNEHCIVGNTVLYGATSGQLYAAGRAGQRFAVRNSGADAVVEGVGDHGCEYMTGGTVVVLGPVGRNFAAGMTGGVAYVLDESLQASTSVNTELVRVGVPSSVELESVRELVEAHARLTGSAHAQFILDEWDNASPGFRTVRPKQRTLDLQLEPSAASESDSTLSA
jgi:glutamate synthase (ferredoxin)